MPQGFFEGFVQGFANTGAAMYERKAKAEDELDLYKKQSVIKADVEKDLEDYKSKKEAQKIKAAQDSFNQFLGVRAINQTPAALNYSAVASTKVSPTDSVDDSESPFTMPGAVSNAASSSYIEEQATAAGMKAAIENPTNPYAAITAYEEAKRSLIKESPEYQVDLAAKKEKATQEIASGFAYEKKKNELQAEIDIANEQVEPVRMEAETARETGAVAPPESYFKRTPKSKENLAKQEDEFMAKWASGESKLGEGLLKARQAVNTSLQMLDLQGNVDTGGIIWGQSVFNNVRVKFDADANLFNALSNMLVIDLAKEVYPVSNTDMQFLKDANASLESPEESNKAKLMIGLVGNQARLEQYEFFNKYKSKWGTLEGAAEGFQEYMAENPLLDHEKSNGTSLVANSNRQNIDAFLSGETKEEATSTSTQSIDTNKDSVGAKYDLW